MDAPYLIIEKEFATTQYLFNKWPFGCEPEYDFDEILDALLLIIEDIEESLTAPKGERFDRKANCKVVESS